MDLFKVRLPKDKLDKSFRQIVTDPAYAPVRDVIQSWGKGLLERSGEQIKFVNEFQSTFNSAFWELYLNKLFIELGFSVDYTKASPDFCVSTPGGYQFNVEAVVSDRPKVLAAKQRLLSEEEFSDHCTIKLMGKLKDKKDIFIGSGGKKFPYSSLYHVRDKPFVIAIAPFDSDFSLSQNNEIINRVLFGIEPPDEYALKTGRQRKVSSIKKPSGAPIDLGIFTNDSYKEVSAVIFSTTGTFGKAVVESGIERIVRVTNYRHFAKDDADKVLGGMGVRGYKLGSLNYLISRRSDFGGSVAGSDVHIYHSRFHRESHFDGLHVYYNPYANVPLGDNILDGKGVTHNFYDIKSDYPVQHHPDGAMVSRQVFEPTVSNLKMLLDMYSIRF